MYELLGIGVDLCQISRMASLLEDGRFLSRWFTREEQAYIRGRGVGAAQSMAGIFAAKEALGKALGTGITLPLTEIGVTHDAQGQPQYAFSGSAAEALRGRRALLSISHDGDMAVAFCTIQRV